VFQTGFSAKTSTKAAREGVQQCLYTYGLRTATGGTGASTARGTRGALIGPERSSGQTARVPTFVRSASARNATGTAQDSGLDVTEISHSAVPGGVADGEREPAEQLLWRSAKAIDQAHQRREANLPGSPLDARYLLAGLAQPRGRACQSTEVTWGPSPSYHAASRRRRRPRPVVRIT
jgi:hypothetical protein